MIWKKNWYSLVTMTFFKVTLAFKCQTSSKKKHAYIISLESFDELKSNLCFLIGMSKILCQEFCDLDTVSKDILWVEVSGFFWRSPISSSNGFWETACMRIFSLAQDPFFLSFFFSTRYTDLVLPTECYQIIFLEWKGVFFVCLTDEMGLKKVWAEIKVFENLL